MPSGIAKNPTLIVSCQPDISANVTVDQLNRRYGAKKVQAAIVARPDGIEEPGFKLPDDRTLLMDPKIPHGRQIIYGPSWSIENIKLLGASIQQIEKINGKRFKLLGFDWVYEGTVTNFNQGKLNCEKNAIILRFRPSDQLAPQVLAKHLEQVQGDREFWSDSDAIRRLKPVVYEVIQRL